MTQLFDVLCQLWPTNQQSLPMFIDLKLEAMGFYILQTDRNFIAKVGDKIMKSRFSNLFWNKAVIRPDIFAENLSDAGRTDYILYEKNRRDIVFTNTGFSILPANPLYRAIADQILGDGFAINKIWISMVMIDVEPRTKAINFWLENDGTRAQTIYEFLADDILQRVFKQTYEAKLTKIFEAAKRYKPQRVY